MVFYATWYITYDENTSNDTSMQHFQTKHSLLIFGVQETLYYLNVASKNRMPHFRRFGLRFRTLGLEISKRNSSKKMH
jgi:hypothetical protein